MIWFVFHSPFRLIRFLLSVFFISFIFVFCFFGLPILLIPLFAGSSGVCACVLVHFCSSSHRCHHYYERVCNWLCARVCQPCASNWDFTYNHNLMSINIMAFHVHSICCARFVCVFSFVFTSFAASWVRSFRPVVCRAKESIKMAWWTMNNHNNNNVFLLSRFRLPQLTVYAKILFLLMVSAVFLLLPFLFCCHSIANNCRLSRGVRVWHTIHCPVTI